MWGQFAEVSVKASEKDPKYSKSGPPCSNIQKLHNLKVFILDFFYPE